MLLNRPKYVDWLMKWRGKDVVKVLTGVRRCGKSTILHLFHSRLEADGVDPGRILSVNLEDPDVERELAPGMALYDKVKNATLDGHPFYVLIDEAQHLAEFERTVAGLGLLPGVDVYITGSNSDLLAGDLATRLTGRYVELHVLPLSYAEYVEAALVSLEPTPSDFLRSYIRDGGFPFVTRLNGDETMIRQYLSGVVSTIVLRDIAPRQSSFTPMLFNSVLEFVMDNVGNLTSITSISNTLTSMGRKTGRSAVERYMDGLIDSYLVYRVPRFDIKGKVYLEDIAKYYAVDTGIRRALLGGQRPDWGNLLENVVFLELVRRGFRVSVGKAGQGEVDFVAELDGAFIYIQVTQRVDSPEALARELAPLKSAADFYPRLLLVGDDGPTLSHEGIKQQSVRDWLMD